MHFHVGHDLLLVSLLLPSPYYFPSWCRSSISTAIKGPPISIFIVGVILTQFLFALSSWMQISFLVFHLKKFFAFLFFVLLSRSSVFIAVFAEAKGVGWYGAFINPLNCYCLLRQLCYFSFRNGTTTRTHNITRFAAAARWNMRDWIISKIYIVFQQVWEKCIAPLLMLLHQLKSRRSFNNSSRHNTSSSFYWTSFSFSTIVAN